MPREHEFEMKIEKDISIIAILISILASYTHFFLFCDQSTTKKIRNLGADVLKHPRGQAGPEIRQMRIDDPWW